MAREKPAGIALDFGDLHVSGSLPGGDQPLAARRDGKGARRGFGGELPDGLETAGLGRNTKAGNAVVAAIGDVKEAAVRSDFQIRASVGRVKICRKSGQALPKADLPRVALQAKDAHAAALFVVEIKAVQLRMKLEVSGAGSHFGADERRTCRRQAAALCVQGKNINRVGSGVGNISPLIVAVNQNCVGLWSGGMPMNRFGGEGALAVDWMDSDFPGAVIGRKQKRFRAIQSKVGGIRFCGDDGDELESARLGIHFVAGNLSGGSIGGKELVAGAIGRKESGFGQSGALPGQDERAGILLLAVDLNLFLAGKRDAHDIGRLIRLTGLSGAVPSKGARENQRPKNRFGGTRRTGAALGRQSQDGEEFHAKRLLSSAKILGDVSWQDKPCIWPLRIDKTRFPSLLIGCESIKHAAL